MSETTYEERVHLKQLRAYLEAFTDEDLWEFEKAFGFAPSPATYAKLGLEIPPGVTFQRLPAEVCTQRRNDARNGFQRACQRLEKESQS
jgi:hypothetical protein